MAQRKCIFLDATLYINILCVWVCAASLIWFSVMQFLRNIKCVRQATKMSKNPCYCHHMVSRFFVFFFCVSVCVLNKSKTNIFIAIIVLKIQFNFIKIPIFACIFAVVSTKILKTAHIYCILSCYFKMLVRECITTKAHISNNNNNYITFVANRFRQQKSKILISQRRNWGEKKIGKNYAEENPEFFIFLFFQLKKKLIIHSFVLYHLIWLLNIFCVCVCGLLGCHCRMLTALLFFFKFWFCHSHSWWCALQLLSLPTF